MHPDWLGRCASPLCACAGFVGKPALGAVRAPARKAVHNVRLLQETLGCTTRIDVFEGEAANALAIAERAPDGETRASIVYSAAFLDAIEEKAGPWAPLVVLAHEVGHHVEADASPLAHDLHPWVRELAADRVSGFALARLGAGLDEAQCVLRLPEAQPAGATHPAGPRRMLAVAQGWTEGARHFRP